MFHTSKIRIFWVPFITCLCHWSQYMSISNRSALRPSHPLLSEQGQRLGDQLHHRSQFRFPQMIWCQLWNMDRWYDSESLNCSYTVYSCDIYIYLLRFNGRLIPEKIGKGWKRTFCCNEQLGYLQISTSRPKKTSRHIKTISVWM